jgi:hypothetical protein
MFSTKMPGFCKNEDCPSSHELLEFQNGDLSRIRGGEIRKHLASCEFCSAEAAFYSRYPQEDGNGEAAETTEIPPPLFELAEALLKNRHADTSSLDSLLKGKDDLVVDKA